MHEISKSTFLARWREKSFFWVVGGFPSNYSHEMKPLKGCSKYPKRFLSTISIILVQFLQYQNEINGSRDYSRNYFE